MDFPRKRIGKEIAIDNNIALAKFLFLFRIIHPRWALLEGTM